MSYATGRLWKAAVALLLALVVSLGTLGVAQAIQPGGASQVRWYEVGGSAADRMLSKDGGVIATWTHVEYYKKEYSWRAYWTVKNTSSSPQKVGCAGYQNYGLKGFKAKIYYQGKFAFEGEVKDAKCVHLGGDYRKMLQPGQSITSWAHFKYAGRKGTCTKLTLPTGPNVPEHVVYTNCVDPYARNLGRAMFEFPWDSSKTLAYTGGPHVWTGPNGSGIDFASGESTHILAMAEGKVTYVGNKVAGCPDCNVVKVSHDNGWDVWYVHLSSFAPDIKTQCQPNPSGDCSVQVPVKQGRYLGDEGGTGAGGVVHIHLELRKGNTPHGWSEVPWGIEGWEFHWDCTGYDEKKAAYDKKLKKKQNQQCKPYKNDGWNYDGYMSKGGTHAIPWDNSSEPRYYVPSSNLEL